ncbi:MAG: type II toxin-antitoxin system HicA family toxin [Rhodocyclaceae bacterium]|nr:type II toxin-antitoxin system HicA family toxin [Rhodocyclaceae bacterium]
MSHKHAHLLATIFTDPPTGNLHWREVESLLHHLGAEIEHAPGARIRVVLNRVEFFLHHPHHSNTCSKHDVKQLREHLARAGVTPSTYGK